MALRSALSVLSLVLALTWGCAADLRPSNEASLGESSVSPSPAEVAAGREAIERKIAKLRRKGPKSPNKPADAMRFFVEQRLALGETQLPMDQLRGELDRIYTREATLLEQDGVQPGGIDDWEWLGPGNIGGRTRALVIDPNDPQRMFAAGVAGGVWSSDNGGASWRPADDLLLNLAVVSLAMDPNNSNVLYAGTGEGIFVNESFVRGLGIFKSVDGGETWGQLTSTVSGVPSGAFDYVNKVVVSPNNSNTVYAATRTGVWRSTNAGSSWALMLGNPQYLSGPFDASPSTVGCTDLVIRTDAFPDMLFAAFGNAAAGGIHRTFDGGATWQSYSVPANQGRTTIALAPSNQDIMYLLMADNGTGGAFGQLVNVFRSEDGGDSFTPQVDFSTLTGPWLLSNLILATGCLEFEGGTYSQGWYDNIIAVDPVDPDTVWVGGVDLFRSDNAGVSFEIPAYWIFYTFDPTPPYYVHADHHLIVFHPDYDGAANQTMFVTNDGGVYRTDNARAATSSEDCPLPGDEPLPAIVWEPLNNGYGVTQFYHGDSAKDRNVFIAGAQDNGTNRVQAAGAVDDWDLIFGGDGGYVAIDPRNSQVVYIEYQEFPSIHKSTDGGDTFELKVEGISDTSGAFISPFEMDQQDPDVLWLGGTRMWRTTDGAEVWDVAGPDFSGPGNITAIAIAPSDSNVVYAGYQNGYVARTTNGLSPSPTWDLFVNGLVGAWVSSLAVHPTDPDTAYLTYSNYGVPHVLRTVNGGASWSSVDGIGATGVPDIPAHWIAIRPCDPQQLYVGTELGLFVSDDAGATWNPSNLGLAHTVVESLDWQTPDRLVAFTHGRGAYRATLTPPCPVPFEPAPPGRLQPSAPLRQLPPSTPTQVRTPQ